MACGSTGEDNVWLLLRKGKASESKHCLHEMSSRQAKKIASWLSLSLSLSLTICMHAYAAASIRSTSQYKHKHTCTDRPGLYRSSYGNAGTYTTYAALVSVICKREHALVHSRALPLFVSTCLAPSLAHQITV